MKPFTAVLLAVAGASAVLARDADPDRYTTYNGFALPATPALPAHETHPSLWFHAADVPALAARTTADEFARSRWAAVLKLADLSAPLPPAPVATDATDSIHQYYGRLSMAARAHALAALIVADPTARAAHRDRAVALLLRAYDGPIYQLDSRTQSGPIDEIYRGTWLQNYVAAYDCVQSSLGSADDAAIRARLAGEAGCIYTNLYAWVPNGPHNHLSKPAWGLGSAALALSDDPRARAWLARALEATNRNTRYFFSGDGLYREGSHYLIFSAVNFIPFLYHYRNVSGVDGFPAFQPVFEAMVETRNSRGWLPNIEDSYLKPTPTHLVAAAYRGVRTALSSHASLAEVLAWSYATCDLRPFDRERSDSGFNFTGASWDYPLAIDEFLTHDTSIRATAPDCPPNVFLQGGQTVLRNAWTTADAGQRYLLLHNVGVADNHNHDDELSFILEAEGQLMCSDSGYSRGTYTGKERKGWYVTAPAHNTLTLDGEPADQLPNNKLGPPGHFAPGADVVVADGFADFPHGARWHRRIAWIGGDYYVVIDSVEGKRPAGVLRSYLHGGRGALTRDGDRYTWTYSADAYGPAAQLHAWLAAPEAAVAEKSGELTYIKGDYAEFPYLELSGTNTARPWLMVLKPAAAGDQAAFAVTAQPAGAFNTVHIATDAGTTLVAARGATAATLQLGDVETDADVVVVRRDAAGHVVTHWREGGSFLRIAGVDRP